MTDRHPKGSHLGTAGRLDYRPLDENKGHDCHWTTSRNVAQQGPVFRELSSPEPWYRGNANPISPLASGNLWQRVRRQEAWLLKNQPEARFGNVALFEDLSDAQAPLPQLVTSWRPRHLCLGEMTDTSKTQKVSGVPLMARVVGGAQNILHVSRPSVDEWQWGDNDGARLLLASPNDSPALTCDEGNGPIRRIQTFVDSKRYDPTRWLAVQWESLTAVFQPEYRRVPVVSSFEGPGEASRIASNRLFAISTADTGGSPHTDVAFNPAARSKPLQVAIIDERGCWTIWGVERAKGRATRRPKPKLEKHGHIHQGVLNHGILDHHSFKTAGWHTALWVGGSDNQSDPSADMQYEDGGAEPHPRSPFPQIQRSSTLLLGNSKTIRLLDTNTDTYLPELSFVAETSLHKIMEVKSDPQDPRYFYLLTSTHIFVLGVFSSPGTNIGEFQKRWCVLLACPHYRDAYSSDLQLNVAPGARSAQHTSCLLFLSAPGNPWSDILYFNISRQEPELVTVHREGIVLQAQQGPRGAIDSLHVLPCPVVSNASQPLTTPARRLVEQQTRFYQIVTLDVERNVVGSLCVSSSTQTEAIEPPDQKIIKVVKHDRERRRLIQQLTTRFVVADYEPSSMHSVSAGGVVSFQQKGHDPFSSRMLGPVYDQVVALSKRQNDVPGGEGLDSQVVSDTFESVRLAVEEALEGQSLPACTLLQAMKDFNLPRSIDDAANQWEEELEGLQLLGPDTKVLKLPRPGEQHEWNVDPLRLVDAYRQLQRLVSESASESHPDESLTTRSAALRKAACDLFLSSCGVVHPVPELTLSYAPDVDDMAESVLDGDAPSPSVSRFSSPAPSASSVKTQTEEPDEDPSMTLLRAYTGTGKFVPNKRFELLSKWRIGTEPDERAFDLRRDVGETPGMQRRAKMLARENRKRRRAETLRYMQQGQSSPIREAAPMTQLPAAVPEIRLTQKTQPRSLLHSSQLQHLHSDPVTMSQPVSGAFAQRPKKKVKKKKGF